MNKDLTVGKPFSVLFKFCLPLFGSIIFQQLYNMADSFVAGKFISENAMASVSNSYEITLIFIAFAFGCNIGCSVIVSQLFGAKKHSEMKSAVYTSLISGCVLCGILMLSGIGFCDKLLRLIDTPENVFEDSKLYLYIYIYGLPFVFFYNISTGIFSALGDSKTPFIFLAISSLSNIGMDILFVAVFDMGVAGVAWATFICQGVSCVLAVIFVIFRLKKIEVQGKVKIFSWKEFKSVAIIAIPSILQQSFISIGNLIIQRVINGFGSGVMAGYGASIKLNNLVVSSFVTLGNGISNFTAQNIGAELYDRVKKGFAEGLKIILALCVPLVILYVTVPKYLVLIFLKKPTAEAIKSGRTFLLIVAPCYIIISVKFVADGILRGAGLMKRFTFTTFTDLILRVVLAKLLSETSLGYVGIWCAWPIGWGISTLMSYLFYKFIKWDKYSVKREVLETEEVETKEAEVNDY